MAEASNIVEELKHIHHSEGAWHGPGLWKILAGIHSDAALARPLADYGSIWEIVLHISKWEEVFCVRLEGHPMELPIEGDWPAIGEESEDAWQNALNFLDETHDRLIRIVSELEDSDLEKTVTGKDYSVSFMLHGIVRHHVYHAGQIALLKRL